MIHVVGRSDVLPDFHVVLTDVDTYSAIIVSNALVKTERTTDGHAYKEVLMFDSDTGNPCGHFRRSPQLPLPLEVSA